MASGSCTSSTASARPHVVGNGSVVGPQGANGYGPMLARPGGAGKPSAQTDAHGFTTVVPRYRKAKDGKAEDYPSLQEANKVAEKGTAVDGQGDAAMASGNAGTGTGEVIEVADDSSVGEEADGPTLDQLRECLEKCQKAVRNAEGDFADDHPVLISLRHHRDQARAALEAAKLAKPDFARLRQAGGALRKAQRARDETRTALEELKLDYKAQLARVEEQLDGDEDKVRAAQAEYDQVLRSLGKGQDGELRQGVERCKSMLSALDVNGPKLQQLAVELQATNPAQAALLTGVVEQLEREYKESRAVLQRQTNFFRLDDEGDVMERDIDELDESSPPAPPAPTPPVPPVLPASGPGPGTGRSRDEEDPAMPAAKKFCDGLAPMECEEGGSQQALGVDQLLERAQAANLQVTVNLDALDSQQLRAWAVANGLVSQ